MPADAIIARLIELAAAAAGPARGPAVPTAETRLANGGYWLDSLALVELLVACEEAFGIVFDDKQLTANQLKTVGTLASLVEERVAARPSN